MKNSRSTPEKLHLYTEDDADFSQFFIQFWGGNWISDHVCSVMKVLFEIRCADMINK